MKKLIRLTIITAVAFTMIISSCEKNIPSSGEVFENEIKEKEEGMPILGVVPLSEINYELKENRLSFENAYEFRRALNAVTNAKMKDVLLWLENVGFYSHFNTYNEAMMRLEQNPNVSLNKLLTSYEKDNLLVNSDNSIQYNSPSLSYSYLTNDAGELLIDNDLNVFRKDFHILVDGAKKELYNQVLNNKESNEEVGVLFTSIKSEDVILNSQDKSANKFFSFCPVDAPSSLAHQIVRKTGGTKRKMVCTLSQMSIALTITIQPFGNKYDYSFQTLLDIHNTRKSGFHWIRTYPNYSVTNGMGSGINVSRVIVHINRANNFIMFLSNYLGLATNGSLNQTSFGTADETIMIDDVQRTVDWGSIFGGCSTCEHLASTYSINGGRVNVKWLNHDTGMEIELGCP